MLTEVSKSTLVFCIREQTYGRLQLVNGVVVKKASKHSSLSNMQALVTLKDCLVEAFVSPVSALQAKD